jgi:acetolactate synthase I/II/III large subunit
MEQKVTGRKAGSVKAGDREHSTSSKKSYAGKRWQSDIIVDLIKEFGFPYIALNPGASYRGLHDSLVNYGGNDPPR